MRNIVFLGAGRIAFRCLRRLCETAPNEDFFVKGVVSTTEMLSALGEPLGHVGCSFSFTNESRQIDELALAMKVHGIDTLISVQHPWILPSKILGMVPNGAWNLHNAPLPRFQGHNCFSHAIAEGHDHFGVTMHQMVEQVDSGPIAEALTFGVPSNATAKSLYLKSLRFCDNAFASFVKRLITQDLELSEQSGTLAYYGKSEMDSLRNVTDISDPAMKERIVRACYFPPYEPAYEFSAGKKIFLSPESEWPVTYSEHRPANSIWHELDHMGRHNVTNLVNDL